jgi:hypothetical protein
MQVLRKVNPQSTCESILDLDHEIVYSSYVDVSGSIVGEATKVSIASYNRLAIMVIPIPSGDSLILATVVGSNIAKIVEKARRLLIS